MIKKIDDTPTYLELALIGYAWFMPDIIGIYRDNTVSMTRGNYDNPALEARHYNFVMDNVRSWYFVKDKLYGQADSHVINRWYAFGMVGLMQYFALARPRLQDRLKVSAIIIQESGFMPDLWRTIIIEKIRSLLHRITPLHKLYRFIKYRLRGRPYPED